MAVRKYYIVVAKSKLDGKFEMMFGDYVKSVANDERDDIKNGWQGDVYTCVKVLTVDEGQAAIDAKMAELNKGK